MACGSETAPIADAADAAIVADASAPDASAPDASPDDARTIDAGISDAPVTMDASTSTRSDSGFAFQPEIRERTICTLPATPDAEEWRVRFYSHLLRVYARAPLSATEKAEVLREIGAVRFHCEDEEPQRTSFYTIDTGSSATLGAREAQAALLRAKPFVLAASAIIADQTVTRVPPETDDEAQWRMTHSSSPNHTALHGVPGMAEYVASYLAAGHVVGTVSLGMMDEPVQKLSGCTANELPAMQDGCVWAGTPCAVVPFGSRTPAHGTDVAYLMAARSNGSLTCWQREGNGFIGGLPGTTVEITAFRFDALVDAASNTIVDSQQVTLRGMRDACGLPAINHSWGLDFAHYLTLTGTVAEAWHAASAATVQAWRDVIAQCPQTLHVMAAGNEGVDLDLYPELRMLNLGAPPTDDADPAANELTVQATQAHSEAPIFNQSVYAPIAALGARGTSFAAPKVTAMLGLLHTIDPTLTGQALKDAVIRTGPTTAAESEPTFLDAPAAFLVTAREAGKDFSPLTILTAEYEAAEVNDPPVANARWSVDRSTGLLEIEREGAYDFVDGMYQGRLNVVAQERFDTSVAVIEVGSRKVPTLRLEPTTASWDYTGKFRTDDGDLGQVSSVTACFEIPGGGVRHIPLGRNATLQLDVQNRVAGMRGVIASRGRGWTVRGGEAPLALADVPSSPCVDSVPTGLTDNTAARDLWIREQQTRTSTVCDSEGNCTYPLVGYDPVERNLEAVAYDTFGVIAFDCDWSEEVSSTALPQAEEDVRLADVNGVSHVVFASQITRRRTRGGPCVFTLTATGRSVATYEIENLLTHERFAVTEVGAGSGTEDWEWRTEDGVFPMSFLDGLQPSPRLQGPGLGAPGEVPLGMAWAHGLGPVGPANRFAPIHVSKLDRTVGRP